MKKFFALLAGIGLAAAASSHAYAQSATPVSPSASSPVFNPFASFSLNRFTFNTLGFLQVAPTNPFAQGATTTVATSGGDVPQAVVIRPPYRPPVRSPYQPPPRPPF